MGKVFSPASPRTIPGLGLLPAGLETGVRVGMVPEFEVLTQLSNWLFLLGVLVFLLAFLAAALETEG